MPVPGPPPAPRPRATLDAESGTPAVGTSVVGASVDGAPVVDGPVLDSPALDEVRARLDALDDVALEQHPEQFTSIDSLLRSALDGTDRALRS